MSSSWFSCFSSGNTVVIPVIVLTLQLAWKPRGKPPTPCMGPRTTKGWLSTQEEEGGMWSSICHHEYLLTKNQILIKRIPSLSDPINFSYKYTSHLQSQMWFLAFHCFALSVLLLPFSGLRNEYLICVEWRWLVGYLLSLVQSSCHTRAPGRPVLGLLSQGASALGPKDINQRNSEALH